jgi:hypothetical protein
MNLYRNLNNVQKLYMFILTRSIERYDILTHRMFFKSGKRYTVQYLHNHFGKLLRVVERQCH